MQQYWVKYTKILAEKEAQILKKSDEGVLRKNMHVKKIDHDATVSINEKSMNIKSQNKGRNEDCEKIRKNRMTI